MGVTHLLLLVMEAGEGELVLGMAEESDAVRRAYRMAEAEGGVEGDFGRR